MKKKIMNTMIIVLSFILIIYGMVMLFSDIKYRNEKLESYCYSSGGDMNGSHYYQKIKKYDDVHALMSVSKAEWHYQDATVNEYLLDIQVLEDIEKIFKKYNMQNWESRKISNIFVCDGASYSYCFVFTNEDTSFSSQIYPKYYSSKLTKIDEIIDSYTQNAIKLPGLIRNSDTSEENYGPQFVDGQIIAEVYEYREDVLYYRILNGGQEDINIYKVELCNSEQEIIYLNSQKPTDSNLDIALAGEEYDNDIKLSDRLPAGQYTLTLGDLNCIFEIGEN